MSAIEIPFPGKAGSCRIHPSQESHPQRKFADACEPRLDYSTSTRCCSQQKAAFHPQSMDPRRSRSHLYCRSIPCPAAGRPARAQSLATHYRSSRRNLCQSRATEGKTTHSMTSRVRSDLDCFAAQLGDYVGCWVCDHQKFPALQDRVCNCRIRCCSSYDPEGIHWKNWMPGRQLDAGRQRWAKPEDQSHL